MFWLIHLQNKSSVSMDVYGILAHGNTKVLTEKINMSFPATNSMHTALTLDLDLHVVSLWSISLSVAKTIQSHD
jgi:hypothetical protein